MHELMKHCIDMPVEREKQLTSMKSRSGIRIYRLQQ